VTALNFGAEPIEETVVIPDTASGPVVDMLHETIVGDLSETGELLIRIGPYEGLSLRIVGELPALRTD
jgi:hypothetical protein